MATTTPPASSPVKAEPDDWLGYSAYADALWSRVVRALDKDKAGKPLGDDPLVIGIFGEWGAGKSHLLKLVYQRAQEQSARDIEARVHHATDDLTVPLTVTVPVMFQPWKYEHEPHLHVPLAIHVADALEEAWEKLPADIEIVKKWVEGSIALGKTANEKIEVVTKTLGKLNTFFKKTKAFVKSDAAEVVAGTLDVMATAMLIPPVLSLGLSKVRERLGDDESDDGESAKEKPAADKKAEAPKRSRTEKKKQEFSHSTDGLAFYRIEKLIRAMTRPKLSAKLLADAGLKIADGIEFDLRINFVVFVDDLDRCLPEKAVEMLELIKTMFNVESFAFVLALDDEVIERGIGHRYKEYQLVGKKPEMPITGFEYLEKIVHLPFRLPALTREQAGAFVRRYEEDIEPDALLRWFEPAQQAVAGSNIPVRGKSGESNVLDSAGEPSRAIQPPDLLDLALSGFDAYMPRKLIRMVELLHQIAKIAAVRNAPLQLSFSGSIDVRVVLALLLVQLFQPELYRILRRREESFPALLAAFAKRNDGTNAGSRELNDARVSDIDLWQWAVNSGHTGPRDLWNPPNFDQIYGHAVQEIARVHIADSFERVNAQIIRLPMVAQIIGHRAVNRHVFDVLKLMTALAGSMESTNSDPRRLTFRPYLSLLSQPPTVIAGLSGHMTLGAVSLSGSLGTVITKDTRLRFNLRDTTELVQSLLSADTAVQANLASRNELREGEVLARGVTDALAVELGRLLAGAEDTTSVAMAHSRANLLNGLQYLAPYVAQDEGAALWQLVDDAVDLTKATDPKLRALWGDVRRALGCDDRFDPQNFYLPKVRFVGHSAVEEPLAGFVRVPAGAFTMGGNEDKDDNPPESRTIDKPFYISRTLVTVDQYSAFIRDGGYAEGSPWWDKQGTDWRNGSFDSNVKDDEYKKHLASRTVAHRAQPMHWEEQKALGSRPVWGVNWFEARAYARWLNKKIEPSMTNALGARHSVMLPTELQWERAARATSLVLAGGRTWPWGNQEFIAEHHANLNQAIGGVCAVGLFPPNPIGLYDMAGNTWEWMDNLYQLKVRDFARVNKDRILVSEESSERSDRPTWRGGSWFGDPGYARCSFRYGSRPGVWSGLIGFRVALSLAN